MVCVTELNVGPVVDPDAESTSNWNVLEVPPPGLGVITEIVAVIPPVAALANAGEMPLVSGTGFDSSTT
jgi:hypothetical protein